MPDLTPSSKRKNSLLRLLGTLIAAALLVVWLIQNGAEVVDSFSKVGWEGFLVALLLTLVSRFATVGRWHSLLRSADMQVTPRQSIQLTFAGLFAANFLPTTVGGDLVRFAGAVKLGLDATVVAASLVADRLVGMAGMGTVLPLSLYQIARTPLPLPAAASWIGLIGAAAAPSAWQRGSAWVKTKLGQLWTSLLGALRLWLSRPGGLLLAYLFTWGHMLAVFTSVFILFQRMGEPIPFWLVGVCWVMSYFPTLLPVSINGLGVQELTLTFFYVNYGGVSLPAALTMASLIRVLQALASLPGAAFVPGLLTDEVPG